MATEFIEISEEEYQGGASDFIEITEEEFNAPVEEPDQPFFAVEDVVSAIGTIPEALSVGVPAAFQKLVTGTAMPEESEAIEKDIAFQERMRQEQQDRQAAGKSSMVGEAIREAAPSIATSFGGLGAGIAGAIGGTVVGGPVGATVGGMAASGTASYRMAAADLLYRSFKALEEQKGSPLTEEEKAQAYKEFLPLAQNSALWEAGPEAVSNAVLLGAGKFVFGFGKPLARKLVGESIERVNKGIASKVAAGVGATATELGTETITAVGQFPAQAKAEQFVKTGTTEGAPTEYPGGAMQAFKDVAPATLALTGMMAGAGGVAKAATLPFQKAKTPEQIAEDNINLDADREADNLLIPDNDTESKSIKSQIDTERADLALKKELYNTLPDGDKTKAVLATEIKEYEGRITELDNTLRQRLGLSLPITTAEQQQIELAKQIAAPAEEVAPVAEAVTPAVEAPAVEVAPVEPSPPVKEVSRRMSRIATEAAPAPEVTENAPQRLIRSATESGLKPIKPREVGALRGFYTFQAKDSGSKIAFSSGATIAEENPNELNIEAIYTPPKERGTGSASRLLNEILSIADKNNITLKLEPKWISDLAQEGDVFLTKKQLASWYKRYGFQQETEGSDDILVRAPASETITPAEPEGISVGNRIKLGKSPQTYTIEKVIPQSATERELGEQYYSVKNERTGETQVVEARDLRQVKGKGARKLFAGERAEIPQFMRDSLDSARAMAAAGKTTEEIRAVTGWFPGKYDGKMRWEIPDKNSKLTTEVFLRKAGEPSFESLINKYYNILKNQGSTIIGNLSEILDHKDLYDSYPDIKNIQVEIAPLKGKSVAAFIAEKPKTEKSFGNPNTIILNARNFPKDIKSVLLHEIQHAIQNKESFAKGGSTKEFGKKYTKLAGEIEARDIQARKDLTPEQLAATAPYSSENISPEDAIVIQESEDAASEVSPTPENILITPPDQQYTFNEVFDVAYDMFGGEIPEGFTIVNDSKDKDFEFKAAYIPESGEIIVNLAYLNKNDDIRDAITHELGHYIYGDPEFRAAFDQFIASLSPEARAELDAYVDTAYNKETGEIRLEEKMVRAFVDQFINEENAPAWRSMLDAIKRFLNKLGFKFNISDRDAISVFTAALDRYKAGEAISREGLSQRFQKTSKDIRRMAAAQPAPEKPAEEKPITDPATPDEQTQQLVQQAQEQESLVDSAVKEAGTTVFDVFNKLVNEGKTEDQVAKELGISNYDVRKYKLRADTAILNKMKQKKVKPLAFAPKNPVAEFAEKNLRKYFTKEGWLPKAVFQSWVKRNAALSREQKEAEFAIKDLYAGIREVFGISKMEMIAKGLVSVPPEFVQQLNDALAGKIDINTMPEPVREPLTRMRQHIDAMSRQLVDLNVLPDELAAKISENLGVYLTRSYKIFTDKNWINKIPTEKLTAARNFLYQQQLKNDPEATIEMADRELRNMLNDWASDAEGLRKRGGKLGAKDLTVMMERAKVPKVLREVMGENTNVIFNYANTIGKISRFVADQKFLNEVKAKGTGEFLFTEKDAPKGFNTQIAAEESRTMSPLNGLRTTPEIAKAFEEFGKGYDARENPGLYVLAWMNAVGKLNLTVGSVLTQIRNLLGQPAFFVFNGHYNWRVIRQEIDAIAKEKGVSQEDAKKELVKLAAAQGLVNENAYAGELRTAFQDVGLETFDDIGPDEFTKQFVLTRMYLKGVKSAQELYQKTDEFGKIVGWLNETKRIQRMNKGMDKQTAQSIAAERTRDTYPTYSQSSEALRLFRRQPFVGPFATFFYETFRTSFHNLRYAFEDINGPTPEHKAEGIKRLAGAMTTLSMGAFGINLLSKLASGIGDDEEEDVRRMLPPWAKDASLAWMPKSKDGTYNFINVSYINPYNAMTDPFIAMMSGFAKGDKPEEIAVQALGSFLSPFTSEQPVTATIGDAARNRTSTGKQIYNPQDDITTKTSKIMLHIFGKTFTPGTITRLRERIIPAIQGETVGTRAPAPAKEIAAELTGIRFETLDMKAAFSNKAWEFSKAANESERIFRDVATRRRRVDEQEQIDAYRRSEQTRYEIWNDMYRDYMAVRRAGASPAEAIRLMTDIGISKKEAIAISKGRYVPYQVSDEVLRRSKLNENKVPIKEIRAIGKEMPRVLTDITKTP